MSTAAKPKSPLRWPYKVVCTDGKSAHLDGGNDSRRPWICVYKRDDGWYIGSNSDSRIPDSLQMTPFPTPDLALEVGVSICADHDKKMREFAAPKALIDAIHSAERDVDKMVQEARSLNAQIFFAKHSIDALRKAAGLPANPWRRDDLIEHIETFTLCASSKAEHMKNPFFTESTLYDLLGKEDARSVLAIIAQVKRRIDPVGGAV